MRAAATAHGADVVLAYGANRTGSAIPWLTTWPVTREALFVLPADGAGHLLVGFHNHVPDARRTVLAADLGDEAARSATTRRTRRCGLCGGSAPRAGSASSARSRPGCGTPSAGGRAPS
ncbi:hypothetical protein ACFQX6_05435 [Streptosporangium lutulentum]